MGSINGISAIKPSKSEIGSWKQMLYESLSSLSRFRSELRPKKDDSLNDLLERFLYWASVYNDGYFPEMDYARDNRFCAWLVQEFDRMYG